MTSSVASDRTAHLSSPPRPLAFLPPNLLKRFFLMCSGATPALLYAPSCVTELNKYAMLGAILCFTAGFAAFSGRLCRVYGIRRASSRHSARSAVGVVYFYA